MCLQYSRSVICVLPESGVMTSEYKENQSIILTGRAPLQEKMYEAGNPEAEGRENCSGIVGRKEGQGKCKGFQGPRYDWKMRVKPYNATTKTPFIEHCMIKYPYKTNKESYIDENVGREMINHRSLRHPNIVRFKEVVLTPTHLAILMEYAAGGELFERICNAGRFSEDEARFFFQQLISGVNYCHAMQVCHRDLKLENTLLDGSSPPRLKICDFGYSKSSLLHSQPKSTVGTPAYIAPEVLSKRVYDGKIADVWSCGVTLYVMLVGAYPFEDPEDPRNFRKTIGRILSVQYSIPDYVYVTAECRHLLSRIFVANPAKRITIPEIWNHPWLLKELPVELLEGAEAGYQYDDPSNPLQSEEEIRKIFAEARSSAGEAKKSEEEALVGGLPDPEDMDVDGDVEDDVESSGDFVCAL
ncbi:hypothetical protein KI387_031140 [Taxus chinensis]|uniref:non-specific serine/threonine protein kinase n=1 Tax=Taxus chinensis TaxID=29808 RepID=A0AA38CIC0_TAXCH|nr:hypothetical protein KI387_031140 [Taxus chinensis]